MDHYSSSSSSSMLGTASLVGLAAAGIYTVYANLRFLLPSTNLQEEGEGEEREEGERDEAQTAGRIAEQHVARALQKFSGVQIFQCLRIPDSSNRGRREIDLVLLTKRRLYVVEVKNWSGAIKLEADGSWLHIQRNGSQRHHPNIVDETRYRAELLESYMARRGAMLPSSVLHFKVVLVNPNCRVDPAILSQSEVLSFDEWENFLGKEAKKGIFQWIKFLLPKGKKESLQNSLHKQLCAILSTSPTWDRLELEGGRIVIGDFLHFQGESKDIEALRDAKRSRVSHMGMIHHRQWAQGIIGMLVGIHPEVEVNCMERDYHAGTELTMGKPKECKTWMKARVRPDLEVVFQPVGKKKSEVFRVSGIISLSLSV